MFNLGLIFLSESNTLSTLHAILLFLPCAISTLTTLTLGVLISLKKIDISSPKKFLRIFLYYIPVWIFVLIFFFAVPNSVENGTILLKIILLLLPIIGVVILLISLLIIRLLNLIFG
jgi:hypothetical protein